MEKVKNIVSGTEPLPSGLRAGTVIKAMEDYALKHKDIDLIRSLANSPLVSETSIHAQELRLLAERDPSSPVKVAGDIIKTRMKTIEKKFAGKTANKVVKSHVKKGRGMIKPPAKADWDKIMREVRC